MDPTTATRPTLTVYRLYCVTLTVFTASESSWRCFLRASAMLKHVIAIGLTSVRPSVTPSVRPSVRPSVCPSVTRWHPIKTAEYIVMLSSPHDSLFILVLCISRSSRNSDGVTPCGGAKYRWGNLRDFLPISRYISQTIQDIAMVAMEGE